MVQLTLGTLLVCLLVCALKVGNVSSGLLSGVSVFSGNRKGKFLFDNDRVFPIILAIQ